MPKAKEKIKTGRPPTVFDENQIIELKALAGYLTKTQIADYFEITEKTLREVEARQPEVATAYKNGKAVAIASIAGNLINQAQQGSTAAAIFYLKTQAGWKEAQEEIKGDGEINKIQIEVIGANGKN